MNVEEMRSALFENAYENIDEKVIRMILAEGFEGFDNMSDADVKEHYIGTFEDPYHFYRNNKHEDTQT